jgi:hypothetical protein
MENGCGDKSLPPTYIPGWSKIVYNCGILRLLKVFYEVLIILQLKLVEREIVLLIILQNGQKNLLK